MRYTEDGELVVNEDPFTTFRQVGWLGQTGRFYSLEEVVEQTEPGGFSPVYIQTRPE